MKKPFLSDAEILDTVRVVVSKEMALQHGPSGGLFVLSPYPCHKCGTWFWCRFYFSRKTSRWNHKHLCAEHEKAIKRICYINSRERLKAKARDHYKNNSKRILKQQKKYKQRKD